MNDLMLRAHYVSGTLSWSFQRNEAVSFCITMCVATNTREGVRSMSGQTERGFTEGDRALPSSVAPLRCGVCFELEGSSEEGQHLLCQTLQYSLVDVDLIHHKNHSLCVRPRHSILRLSCFNFMDRYLGNSHRVARSSFVPTVNSCLCIMTACSKLLL